MQRYEYRVVPAPRKGEKSRGIKSTEERFAFALTQVMNKLAAEGWEYQRADALPCDERVGLTGSKTVFQNMMVFRRPAAETLSELVETTMTRASLTASLTATAPGSLSAPLLGAAAQPIGTAPALGPANPNPNLAAE